MIFAALILACVRALFYLAVLGGAYFSLALCRASKPVPEFPCQCSDKEVNIGREDQAASRGDHWQDFQTDRQEYQTYREIRRKLEQRTKKGNQTTTNAVQGHP